MTTSEIVIEENQTSPPPIEQQDKTEKKTPDPIDVKHGALVPKNNSELVRMINMIAAGGGFPDRFDTIQKQMAAYNLAHSLMGSRWQLAINHIAEVKGSLVIYGELPGTLAEETGEVAEKHVYAVDAEYNIICTENKNLDKPVFAGVCKIQRKGRVLKEYTYTVDEAKHAKQIPATKRDGSINHESPWMKWPKVMLMRKALAFAIKMEFPDALLGTAIAEYDHDTAPDLIDVSSRKGSSVDAAANLNSLF